MDRLVLERINLSTLSLLDRLSDSEKKWIPNGEADLRGELKIIARNLADISKVLLELESGSDKKEAYITIEQDNTMCGGPIRCITVDIKEEEIPEVIYYSGKGDISDNLNSITRRLTQLDAKYHLRFLHKMDSIILRNTYMQLTGALPSIITEISMRPSIMSLND